MEDSLLASRTLMGVSLGFHIIFAIVGMVMPLIMSRSHYLWLKSNDRDYYLITKWWMKGLGIFFATGAVSGTTLSFELGLLWPKFMEHAGPIFGMPFSWEGTAFFLEAIFLGLYLYGFKHLSPWTHWLSGLGVGICGVASGIFVVAANSWMNSPSGFDWVNGQAINVDPVAAMFNDAWFAQSHHTVITAILAVSTGALGIHAFFIIKNINRALNMKAFKVVLPFFIFSALLAPLSGDHAAKDVARRQPLKLAAMEAHFETTINAPLIIGGYPNLETKSVDFALKIPSMLSVLAHGDRDAEVKGLEEFDPKYWPKIVPVHFAFQTMVAIGTYLFLIAAFVAFFTLQKKNVFKNRLLLKSIALATPLGFIAIEAGWMVTELGRQPWIIYQIMTVNEAVTPMPGVQYMLFTFGLIYLTLSAMVSWLMYRQFKFFTKSVADHV